MKLDRQWWVQEIINDNTSHRIGVHAGYNSGKTFGAWDIVLDRMKSSPRVKTWCWTEPIYKLIKSIAIPKFEDVAQFYGLKEKRDYNILKGDTLYIDFPKRKQRILLFSCEKPDNLVGFDAMFCVRDEAGLCKKESRQRLGSRLRDTKGAYRPQLLDVGTPEGITDFADQYDETQEGWHEQDIRDYIKIIENHKTGLDTIMRSFRVMTMDNKYATAEYVNSIYTDYGFNENYIRSYIYGFFTPFVEGLACPSFNPKIHILEQEIKPDPYKPICLTFDFNANPVSWLAIQEHSVEVALREFEKGHVILDESEIGYGLLQDSLTEFEVKFPPALFGNTEILIYGDRSGYAGHHQAAVDAYKDIKQELDKRGYKYVTIKAPRAVTSEATAIEATNKIFYDNKLWINPHCKQIVKSLLSVVLKDNERKILKPTKDTITHKYDALKYWVCHHVFGVMKGNIFSYNL